MQLSSDRGEKIENFDIKKLRSDLYSPSAKQFALVEVPPMKYLMVDGEGDPNTAVGYREAVEALYATSYAIRFAAKDLLGKIHVVGPLEGLWWAEDMNTFLTREKSAWKWTMMIHQPDWIAQDLFEAAKTKAAKKLNTTSVESLRFEVLDEGLSAQIMHIGSYDDETAVLQQLHHKFLPEHSLTLRGKHHEIYISDPRKVEPARLKTVLRQPVSRPK